MEEAGAFLSIQIFPYKLTQGALEARLATGETVLPGQLLRFDELPFTFGEVSEVQALPDSVAGLPEGHNVKITLLRGTPSLKPTRVTPLNSQEMVAEVVQLLPAPEYPVDFGTFRSDYLRLGPFTLVEGPNFLLKYQALLAMMEAVRPYQKMLILDPLGVFESVGDIACYQAGETVRLSLQEVSIRRFLDAFGSMFPEGVRKPVTEAVASHWPASGAFSGFSPLLVSGMITESLLKNIILQNCAHVIRNKLFAEAPTQVLDLRVLAKNPVSVLDLSLLQEPWKSFFYQEVLAQVFSAPELGLTPVLIYPENYLPDLPDWIQRADETDRHMLAVASNYGPPAARQWASNLVSVRPSQLPAIRGELTLGLPVAFGEAKDWLEPLPVPQPVSESSPVAPVIAPPPEAEMVLEAPLESSLERLSEAPPVSLPEVELGLESPVEVPLDLPYKGSAATVSTLVTPDAEPPYPPPVASSPSSPLPMVSPPELAEVVPVSPLAAEAHADFLVEPQVEASLGLSPEVFSVASPESLPESFPAPAMESLEPASQTTAGFSETIVFSTELSGEPPEPLVGGLFNSWQQEGLFAPESQPMETPFPSSQSPDSPFPVEGHIPVDASPADAPAILSSASVPPPVTSPPAMPVVDLSGTVLEETPGFLSLEQLNELLNATPEPEGASGQYSLAESPEDPLDYPDAEEGAIPDAMGDASNFPQPTLAMQADRTAQASVTVPAPMVRDTVPPAFPEPEAYAPDEFDFDLNLDQKVDQLPESVLPVQPSASGSSLGSRIARSLDRFEESPPPLASGPSVSMTEAIHRPQAPVAEVAPESASLPVPIPEAQPEAQSAYQQAMQQQALQENLDLLYPPVTPAEVQAEAQVEIQGTETLAFSAEADRFMESREFIDGSGDGSGTVPVLPVTPKAAASGAEQAPVAVTPVEASSMAARPFQVGDKVRHAQYGLGIVQKVIPVEQSLILNITFEAVGKRLLDPALTQLTLASNA